MLEFSQSVKTAFFLASDTGFSSQLKQTSARFIYDGVFPHELKKYHLPNGEKIKLKCYGKILQ